MTIQIDVRRPFESAFSASPIPASTLTLENNCDAKGMLDVTMEADSRVESLFMPGSEVRAFISDGGQIAKDPDFQGVVLEEINPTRSDSGVKKHTVSVSSPLAMLDNMVLREPMDGRTIPSALSAMVSTPKNIATGLPLFEALANLSEEPQVIGSKVGSSILSNLLSMTSDPRMVNIDDNFNIRFAHLICKYHRNAKPTIVIEMEPDITAGYDVELLDSDIVKIDAVKVPKAITSIIYQVNDIRRAVEWKNRMLTAGIKEYTTTGDSSKAMTSGFRTLVKGFKPTIAFEATLLKRKGIFLNQRVKIESDVYDIHDTFIVLGLYCDIKPTPVWRIQLGYNFQKLEEFLQE